MYLLNSLQLGTYYHTLVHTLSVSDLRAWPHQVVLGRDAVKEGSAGNLAAGLAAYPVHGSGTGGGGPHRLGLYPGTQRIHPPTSVVFLSPPASCLPRFESFWSPSLARPCEGFWSGCARQCAATWSNQLHPRSTLSYGSCSSGELCVPCLLSKSSIPLRLGATPRVSCFLGGLSFAVPCCMDSSLGGFVMLSFSRGSWV